MMCLRGRNPETAPIRFLGENGGGAGGQTGSPIRPCAGGSLEIPFGTPLRDGGIMPAWTWAERAKMRVRRVGMCIVALSDRIHVVEGKY